MIGLLLVTAGMGVIGLISLGVAAEVRRQTFNGLLRDIVYGLRNFVSACGYVRRHHPNPSLAVLETIFWLLMLFPLFDNVLNPRSGNTAAWVWYLTIGPHEIGHVICLPFGRFISVAGGSIWQVLFWAGLGTFVLLVRHRIGTALLMWLIAGHSFINLSVYIRDARARDLDLLFGLDKDAHDWWNLLRWTGLLEYDYILADMAVVIGIIVVLAAIMVALLCTWFLPRTGQPRFRGFGGTALVQAVRQAGYASREDVVFGEIVR